MNVGTGIGGEQEQLGVLFFFFMENIIALYDNKNFSVLMGIKNNEQELWDAGRISILYLHLLFILGAASLTTVVWNKLRNLDVTQKELQDLKFYVLITSQNVSLGLRKFLMPRWEHFKVL